MFEVVTKLQNTMKKQDLAAIIVSGSNNVFYVSQIPVTTVSVNPVLDALQSSNPTIVLVPNEGMPIVFTAGSLKQFFDDQDNKLNVLYYPSSLFIDYWPNVSKPEIYAENLFSCVKKYFKDHPITNGKLGIDSQFKMNPGLDCLGDTKCEIVDGILMESRYVKTKYEIEMMSKAARASYSAMKRVQDIVNSETNVTEIDLFYASRKVMLEHSCQWKFTGLMAGKYSSDIYHQPTEYIIKNGDVIRMDYGAIYKGYCSDVARTLFVGKPIEEYLRVAEAVKEGLKIIVDGLKPGACLKDLYTQGHEFIRSYYPQYKRKHLGHSLGIDNEEPPFISQNSDFIVVPNMIFSVETPYYIKDKAGFSYEDMYLISETGNICLSEGII